uniref:Uncharacterized protein n=1 Tax=Anguilla anguilla TaxID=7936 RepID=A0A0E9WPG0_ANGAN
MFLFYHIWKHLTFIAQMMETDKAIMPLIHFFLYKNNSIFISTVTSNGYIYMYTYKTFK